MAEISNIVDVNGIANAEYFDIRSSAVSDTYRVFVGKPGLVSPGRKYPAIYVLDGNFSFAAVQAMHTGMTITGELPQAFIVGIGYDTPAFPIISAKRGRDFSPTGGGAYKAMAPTDAAYQFGGAAKFLEFITTELKPMINGRYPIDPHDLTVIGNSFGGLFCSWLLLSRPDLFQRYVLCSPSIWWHGEMIWDWEAHYAGSHPDLSASVFVTAGGFETVERTKQQLKAVSAGGGPMKATAEKMTAIYEADGWPRMAEITPEFTAKLQSRNYPNLDICCHNLPDETHMSVWPAGVSRGLRYVFGSWKP
jgi:predicted alpha/beta superfamily hydrolase